MKMYYSFMWKWINITEFQLFHYLKEAQRFRDVSPQSNKLTYKVFMNNPE